MMIFPDAFFCVAIKDFKTRNGHDNQEQKLLMAQKQCDFLSWGPMNECTFDIFYS